MLLVKASRDLNILLEYLINKRGLGAAMRGIVVQYSEDADGYNIKDPRVFCFTQVNHPVIFCSRALEDVDREIRVGILIHEIGHIVLNAFEGDESEIDVDHWVVDTLPKGSYGYVHEIKYLNSARGEEVTAWNLERVTQAFLREIDR